MAQVRTSGHVVDRDTGAGMGGLRVETWDSTGICSDLIGCAFTGVHGAFELALDEDYLRALFRGHTPVLFFRIFAASGSFLENTGETLLWTVQGGSTAEFRIEVNPSQSPRLAMQAAPFVVRGHLRMTPARVRVKAFHKGLASDAWLGSQDVDMSVQGDFYRILYSVNPTVNGTLVQPVFGKQAADIIVRVYLLSGAAEAPVEGALLAESAVLCHAPPTAMIDVASDSFRELSAYEVLIARLAPALGGVALRDVTDAQVPHLACSTGTSVEEMTRIVAAAGRQAFRRCSMRCSAPWARTSCGIYSG